MDEEGNRHTLFAIVDEHNHTVIQSVERRIHELFKHFNS